MLPPELRAQVMFRNKNFEHKLDTGISELNDKAHLNYNKLQIKLKEL